MEIENEKNANEQEVNNNEQNNDSVEEFDISKFSGSSASNNKEEEDENNQNENEENEDDDGNPWSFGDDNENEDNSNNEEEENNSDKDHESNLENDSDSDNSNLDNNDVDDDGEDSNGEYGIKSITKEQFVSFAEEIGITVKTPEEFVKAIKDIEKENLELKERLEKAPEGKVENEVISKLKNLKSKSDEELIRMDLKKQGFTDEEIEESVDTYIDSNLLKIEAKKIRNTIDRVINNEIKKTQEEAQKSEAMRKKEAEESVKALSEHIKGTDTMFGFKIAKDKDSLDKVQKKHIEYITSGNFLGDITKDEKSVAEAAWLWKNKDTLFKALKNSGSQKAREEILNDLSNPEVSGTKRIKGPNSDDGFDAKIFVYGN